MQSNGIIVTLSQVHAVYWSHSHPCPLACLRIPTTSPSHFFPFTPHSVYWTWEKMCSLSFWLVHFLSHGLLRFRLFVHIQYEFVLCDCAHRHHISFICSSSDGHPGCFHKLTVVSSAWRSMRIQASPSQDDVGSLGSRPGWGIVRSRGSSPN